MRAHPTASLARRPPERARAAAPFFPPRSSCSQSTGRLKVLCPRRVPRSVILSLLHQFKQKREYHTSWNFCSTPGGCNGQIKNVAFDLAGMTKKTRLKCRLPGGIWALSTAQIVVSLEGGLDGWKCSARPDASENRPVPLLRLPTPEQTN